MAISEDDQQNSLGKVKQAKQALDAGNYSDGIVLSLDALNYDFENPLALFLAGYAFLKTERFGLAYQLFQRCAQLQPDRSEPWNNAGMCHQETWNLDDAEECFKKALKLEPNNHAALQNLALIYINRCQPYEALKYINRAEKTGHASWEALDNRAMALLMLRKWEGWQDYRATAGRHKERQLRFYCNPEEPMWNGEPGSVVVYGNQGLGDELAFASCIPDAIEKADVIVDCDHRLEGLFKRSFPQAKVYGTRFKEREWDRIIDYSIPSDCLPALFRTRDEDFTGKPYLVADSERRLQWRALFDTYKKPVIGVAWTGGLRNTGAAKRSLTLEDFLPIFKSVDAVFVSLEYKDRSEELKDFERIHGVKILDFPRATRTQDYDDTAAIVAELDLVVTVTTAIVHLSGALGKECWCLAPSKPRFFYGLEGDLPWYRSVKMFRQKKEWPIQLIANLLRDKWTHTPRT